MPMFKPIIVSLSTLVTGKRTFELLRRFVLHVVFHNTIRSFLVSGQSFGQDVQYECISYIHQGQPSAKRGWLDGIG